MAEQDCRPQVQACALRVARLGPDGVPAPGANNLYVSDALTTMSVTPVYTDGNEIELKNGCGQVKLSYRAPDSFKRLDVSLTLDTPDPYLQEFLSGGDVLSDGARRGFAAPPIGEITGNGVSIELWSKRIDDGALDADDPYAWHVYPRITNLRLGDWTHEDGPLVPVYSGQAYQNPNWYDGPLNDWPAESDRVYQWLPTDSIPEAQCGYQTLAAS
jgi:hypothetical protein